MLSKGMSQKASSWGEFIARARTRRFWVDWWKTVNWK
jgi:hypothetical protein